MSFQELFALIIIIINIIIVHLFTIGKLNFRRPKVRWKLFSGRFINAVMTAYVSSISVVAAQSTNRQIQSGSICLQIFRSV